MLFALTEAGERETLHPFSLHATGAQPRGEASAPPPGTDAFHISATSICDEPRNGRVWYPLQSSPHPDMELSDSRHLRISAVERGRMSARRLDALETAGPPPFRRVRGPGSSQASRGFDHPGRCQFSGTSATILSGPPLPPPILAGRAMTRAPVGGSSPRLATFSKPGMFRSSNMRWAMKSCDCP